MQRVVQTIRQIARHEMEQRVAAGVGVVKSVHGANGQKEYACTVEMRDSGLVLARVPIAANVIGAVSLPRENDLVVILFVNQDLHAPVVVGRLYSEDVEPPKHGPGEMVLSLPGDETEAEKLLEVRIKTPGDGTREAVVTLKGSSVSVECRIADDSVEIKVQDVTLSLKQTGSSDGQLELKAGPATVTLKQGGDLSLETSGTLKLKAGKVEINADTTVQVNGTAINLN